MIFQYLCTHLTWKAMQQLFTSSKRTSAICSGPTVSVSIRFSPVSPSSLAMAASTSWREPYLMSATRAKSIRRSASWRLNNISSRRSFSFLISSILSFSLRYFICSGCSLSLKSSNSFRAAISLRLVFVSFGWLSGIWSEKRWIKRREGRIRGGPRMMWKREEDWKTASWRLEGTRNFRIIKGPDDQRFAGKTATNSGIVGFSTIHIHGRSGLNAGYLG